MVLLLASFVLAQRGNPYVDPNLPPDEYALMISLLAGQFDDPGTVIADARAHRRGMFTR